MNILIEDDIGRRSIHDLVSVHLITEKNGSTTMWGIQKEDSRSLSITLKGKCTIFVNNTDVNQPKQSTKKAT
jgi:hypothetical protein